LNSEFIVAEKLPFDRQRGRFDYFMRKRAKRKVCRRLLGSDPRCNTASEIMLRMPKPDIALLEETISR
jgi:hypothetical protein